jgi:hypothetical protein
MERNIKVGDKTATTVNGVTVTTEVVKVAKVYTADISGMNLATPEIGKSVAQIHHYSENLRIRRADYDAATQARDAHRTGPGSGRLATATRLARTALDDAEQLLSGARSRLETDVRRANPKSTPLEINTALRSLLMATPIERQLWVDRKTKEPDDLGRTMFALWWFSPGKPTPDGLEAGHMAGQVSFTRLDETLASWANPRWTETPHDVVGYTDEDPDGFAAFAAGCKAEGDRLGFKMQGGAVKVDLMPGERPPPRPH